MKSILTNSVAQGRKIKHRTEILVIGSGAAGLNFALNAANTAQVTLITKKALLSSNTNYAQGGIAAVMSAEDDFSNHIEDTLKTGCGLCDEAAVQAMVHEAPKQILELMKKGVKFTKKNNTIAVTKEAGHSMPRIVYSRDSTGNAVEMTLVQATKRHPNITIFENNIAFELAVKKTKSKTRCVGAYSLDVKKKRILTIEAKAVIVATGGAGQLYKYNTNPAISTGDGIAMAYDAGTLLEDLEFIQFHPTMLKIPRTRFLISETVRGEGGRLLNAAGKSFMHKYHPMADLAPRDIVARAITIEAKKGPVVLTIAHKKASFIKKRFPMIYNRCKKLGVDITKESIPIVPAAHYICGGIKTDLDGQTNIAGLYAFGETACTGVHGANRLASNSLLESLVFSVRAFRSIMQYIHKAKHYSLEQPNIQVCNEPDIYAKKLKTQVKQIMWEYVGIVRNTTKLKEAIQLLEGIEKEAFEIWKKCLNREVIEARNMALVGRLIALSAFKRHESRGTHYLENTPHTNPSWKKHIKIIKKHP